MYSDLTGRSAKDEYQVYRAILYPRSVFFAKAYNGDFLVCTIVSASRKVVAKLTPIRRENLGQSRWMTMTLGQCGGMLREIAKKHNAKLENLSAELEIKEQDAKAREND